MIVGKRALPAIGLAGEGGDLGAQVELLARADDIAMAFGADEDGGEAARALALARARGCLTIAFSPLRGRVGVRAADARIRYVRQELVETLYHVLWELVHVFFEHRGLLAGPRRAPRPRRRRLELPVPVPGRAGARARAGASTTSAARR